MGNDPCHSVKKSNCLPPVAAGSIPGSIRLLMTSILLLISLCAPHQPKADIMNKTRPSALAGAWYEADAGELAAAVDSHLAAGQPLSAIARGLPIALIAPHAGHRWSGDAAGHAFNLLSGEAGASIRRVIMLGPSHHTRFHGISILPVENYQTPLGNVPLDTAVVSQLLDSPLFLTQPGAHREEHCLEIELPFLQRALAGSFQIVPMLISHLDPSDWKIVAATLRPFIDEKTVILISSDFTHYGARFGYLPFRDNQDLNLKKLDKGALAPILALNAAAFAAYKQESDITICGWQAIGVLLELLGSGDQIQHWGDAPPAAKVLEYYRSADLSGDFDGSVSYAAVGFFRAGDLLSDDAWPAVLRNVPLAADKDIDIATAAATADTDVATAATSDTMELTQAERQFLLHLARETLEQKLGGGELPLPKLFPPGVSVEKMNSVCGVFVTLTRGGRLRGCIGTIIGRDPLIQGVMTRAVSAALDDPRFPPVTSDELSELDLEISILTPLREIDSPDEIVIGRHGVLLEKRGHRAVFLPQVAPEQGWDRETMLDHLAAKAGLPRGGWRSGARFQVFEALVFAEVEDENP